MTFVAPAPQTDDDSTAGAVGSRTVTAEPPVTDRHDPVVSLTGVSRRFGDVLAVDEVDLVVEQGELLAVLGPSGGGKSTLLRLIAGLERPDAGEIRIGDQVVADATRRFVPPERRRVGLVFQDHALFPHLTVAGNIAFGLPRRPRAARRQRVDELLALVHLEAYADRYPHELSGGEQQRVALARALAPRPEVVLLDEPFASLDPDLRRSLAADVARVLRAAGTTAVLVTHDRDEAFAVADRVGVINDGRLVQLATPTALYRVPASASVAMLLGDAAFVSPGSLVALGAPRRPDLPPDARVLVRPHQVRLVDAVASEPTAAGAEAVVTAARFRGDHLLVTADLGDGEVVTAEAAPEHDVAPGTRVHLQLLPDSSLPVYDPDRLVGVVGAGP